MDFKEAMILDMYSEKFIEFGNFNFGKPCPFDITVFNLIANSPNSTKRRLADMFCGSVSTVQYDLTCGAAEMGMRISHLLLMMNSIPMVACYKMTDEEMIEHGMIGNEPNVRGIIQKGKVCLIVADVIDNGALLWTSEELRAAGLKVNDAVVLIDLELGEKEDLLKKGIRLHSVFTLREIVDVLVKNGRISKETQASVEKYLKENGLVEVVPTPKVEGGGSASGSK